MKKIAFFILLITGVILMDACKKVETDPVLDMSTAVAPSMTSPADGSTFVLKQENEGDEILFEWTAAQYNLTDLAAPNYKLLLVSADADFADASEVVNTTETSYSTTVGAMNNLLLSMGLDPEQASEMKMKVVASLTALNAGNVAGSELESAVSTSTMTPYSAATEYPKLWVPGGYQGWAPDQAPFIQSFDSDGEFTGYVYFPEDAESFEFKFTSVPGWDGINYGDGGEGVLSTDGGAGNLSVPGAGGYRFNVNINDLTWSYELQNWGVIGQFTNWENDIDMVWDAENNYLTLTYDVPDAEDNRFKFRANDAWDLNYGAVNPPDGETLTPGGDDIPIESGNYTFHLILSGKNPKYALIKN